MTYTLENTDGQRYSATSLDEVANAIRSGTISSDAWAWHEGLTEWVPVMSLLPKEASKPNFENTVKNAVGTASGLLAKAGAGMAGFAAKNYRKATLKNRFSKALAAMIADGNLDDQEVAVLEQMVAEAGADWEEVIRECQPLAEQFIRHLLADAATDDNIDDFEEAKILKYLKLFRMGDEIKREVKYTIRRVRLLHNLGNNKLPPMLPLNPAWIQSGETIYLCQDTRLYRDDTLVSEGKLWITNIRVEYVSEKAGFSISLGRVREMKGYGTHLIITSVKGKIDLEIVDAEVPAALVLCLLRLNNRTVSAATDDTRQDRRRISKEVRNAVWIRDGGICVECGADDYLEFDHVIPVAKGGSNTVENVQLLCRRCNGKKSDKI
jgi:hypothetical protein